MSYVRRVLPDIFVPPLQAFDLLLLADGFTEDKGDDFASACNLLVQNLLGMTPFNLTRRSPEWINVFYHFTPSADEGPAIDAPAGNTAFRSTYDSANRVLALDSSRVTTVIQGLSVKGEQGAQD